jgi:indole-3-pyruvate monooxygenase
MAAIASDVIVVGAGPAGLAVAACLTRAGVDHIVLEQDVRVGASWHRHYHRLRLHTDKRRSELPYVGYPEHYPRYPSREQVIAYLEEYASGFRIEPRFGQRVQRATYQDGTWEVETADTFYHCRSLVVATGYNAEPHRPSWPGQRARRRPEASTSRCGSAPGCSSRVRW